MKNSASLENWDSRAWWILAQNTRLLFSFWLCFKTNLKSKLFLIPQYYFSATLTSCTTCYRQRKKMSVGMTSQKFNPDFRPRSTPEMPIHPPVFSSKKVSVMPSMCGEWKESGEGVLPCLVGMTSPCLMIHTFRISSQNKESYGCYCSSLSKALYSQQQHTLFWRCHIFLLILQLWALCWEVV